jgi:hypothetical protein
MGADTLSERQNHQLAHDAGHRLVLLLRDLDEPVMHGWWNPCRHWRERFFFARAAWAARRLRFRAR